MRLQKHRFSITIDDKVRAAAILAEAMTLMIVIIARVVVTERSTQGPQTSRTRQDEGGPGWRKPISSKGASQCV